MGSWSEAASFLAALSEAEREKFSRYSGLPGGIEDTLARHAPGGPADLLATTGAMAGASGETDFALSLGEAALEMAEGPEEIGLARVCLAQTHFRLRRDPEHLAAFEEHCGEAVELGTSGTFCYERLAVLYEYRGEVERAVRVCRRAVEALGGAGDERSAERFQKRLARLENGGTRGENGGGNMF